MLKREGYVAEVAVEGKPPRRSRSSSSTTGAKPSSRACAASVRRACAAMSARTEVPRVRGGMGTSILSTSGGNHDGRAGAEEERRRRIALRSLVKI